MEFDQLREWHKTLGEQIAKAEVKIANGENPTHEIRYAENAAACIASGVFEILKQWKEQK